MRAVARTCLAMPSHRSLLVLILASLSPLPGCRAEDGADTGEATTGTAGTTAPTTTGSSGGETPTTGDGDPTTTDPSGETTAGPGEAVGCDGATLLAVPKDTSLPGPWPVGARTTELGGLTVEVWYPAAPGSEAGVDPVRYDIRASLPASEQAKVPDADNPWQTCDCHRDLPLDAAHGPYPAVIFVHGTAGFRSQSLEQVTHWASRGFVVIAADHPGLWLKDLLGQLCGETAPPQDLQGDLATLVAAVQSPADGLAFLVDRVDGARIAMAGHSAGGGAIENSGDVAQVLIPMAAGGVTAGAALRSTLVLGAQADQVVNYSGQKSGYESSPAPRRLVGIANAGHLAFSSLCSLKNAEGQDFLAIAEEYGVCGAQFAGVLFDCEDSYTPDAINWQITNYASSAALEETLHCSDAGANFASIMDRFPEVGEFLEAL
jgi:hypothetical protein